MTSLNNAQKKVIIIGVFVLLLVIIGGSFLLFYKPNETTEEPLLDNETIKEIEPSEAEEMYDTLTEECQGALVWNLAVGEVIEINNLESMNACHNDNYYSKMIGYTYNDIGVVIHVNVLERKENSLYKLDNTYIGEYTAETIDVSLEQGTTYEYVFENQENGYQLVSVKLMEVVGN